MEIVWIILGIALIIFVIVLILIGIYILFILRKTNILIQKVDYLVEDITYKSEALTPTVDLINKISNYGITVDLVAKRSLIKAFKFLKSNQASLFKLLNSILAKLSKDKGKTKEKTEEDFSHSDEETIKVKKEDSKNDNSEKEYTFEQKLNSTEIIDEDINKKEDN